MVTYASIRFIYSKKREKKERNEKGKPEEKPIVRFVNVLYAADST